ncbi:hypothetical protein OE88DRAFT_1740305 [Heliocybe sulcata]|uniref:Uncharacterized protein n=1 Tax=Heliocybe sulcata TaxID=5364 RepID=A0A5C3MJ66_9AGAM|nr:hypothetical protein OE88DRAFT_1740305 [Heliocybe sulcata]
MYGEGLTHTGLKQSYSRIKAPGIGDARFLWIAPYYQHLRGPIAPGGPEHDCFPWHVFADMLPDGEEPYTCILDACPQRDAWLTSEILSLDEIRTASMQSALADFAPTDRDESSHEAPQSAHAPPAPPDRSESPNDAIAGISRATTFVDSMGVSLGRSQAMVDTIERQSATNRRRLHSPPDTPPVSHRRRISSHSHPPPSPYCEGSPEIMEIDRAEFNARTAPHCHDEDGSVRLYDPDRPIASRLPTRSILELPRIAHLAQSVRSEARVLDSKALFLCGSTEHEVAHAIAQLIQAETHREPPFVLSLAPSVLGALRAPYPLSSYFHYTHCISVYVFLGLCF